MSTPQDEQCPRAALTAHRQWDGATPLPLALRDIEINTK